MQYTKVKYLLLLATVVGGCNSQDNGAATPADKNLFSSWARQNPPGLVVDFTGMGFYANALKILITSPVTAECDCTISFSGSQSSGQAAIAGCTFKAGSGTGDPGCAGLGDSYTYTKTSDTLTFCPVGTSTCYPYK